MPTSTDAVRGLAPVVGAGDVPRSLTVRLPRVMRAARPYRLWVRDPSGRWSNPVTINEPHPFWFSPSQVDATTDRDRLGRRLKIIGRNLAADRVVEVRLRGATAIALHVARSAPASFGVRDVAVSADLPHRIAPGTYVVQLRAAGAVSWVAIPGERLRVLPDPVPSRRYDVSSAAFGGCRPDDGRDDTGCLLRAIAAAAKHGGGSVYLGPGTWELLDSNRRGIAPGDGIVLPPGVDLSGAGRDRTRLRRAATWSSGGHNFTFTLTGRNRISGLTFVDDPTVATAAGPRPCLQLGPAAPALKAASARDGTPALRDLVIRDDAFEGVFEAVVDSGEPIAGLVIVRNRFAAYVVDLELPGNRYRELPAFGIEDGIIRDNHFYPSGYFDAVRRTGVLASEIGGSRRLDFSDNFADGASPRFVAPRSAVTGWRGAFFWNLIGNHEDLLVADNVATCTGDGVGDGEAFAFDNNGNTYAFNGTRAVLGATASAVRIAGPLRTSQYGRAVDPRTSYLGFWVDVVAGTGIGQLRRIRGLRIDPRSAEVTLDVNPAWDVLPRPGDSRIIVSRTFFRTYVVGNRVDNRNPPCTKSKGGRPAAGAISLWAQMGDSVIASNRQYDSDGIVMQQAFSARAADCAECATSAIIQSFNEIRDNRVEGEYRWDSACSLSGIQASFAASPTASHPPPVLGYGVLVSHNVIDHADGSLGGAIDVLPTWYVGPPPHRRPLVENMLLDQNVLRHIDGPAPRDECGVHQRHRTGIRLAGDGEIWNTILSGNRCEEVERPLLDHGVGTVRVCAADSRGSCECPAP
ncbi:MAG: hypothetical protein KGL34_10850 [Gammaproteobacteria bacterium]|nr:hypothetical protein [Gammaproteobacteria bacterium]